MSVEEIQAKITSSEDQLTTADTMVRAAEEHCCNAHITLIHAFEGTGNEEAVLALQSLGALLQTLDASIRAVRQTMEQIGNLKGTI